jgi:predicted nucleic acid-binding protein
VDTSGWYALIDRNDAGHAQSRVAVDRLLAKGRILVTTDYIVDESATLTKARAGPHAAGRLLDLLRSSRLLEWEWIGAERFDRAEALFRKHRDQGFSFTDCTSFALMRELRLTEALTADAHFTTAGFRALLRPS